jgi:hypothetical protein
MVIKYINVQYVLIMIYVLYVIRNNLKNIVMVNINSILNE